MEQFKQNKETVLSCIKENGYNPEVIRQHKRMYQPLSSFLFSNGRANGKDAYEKCQQPDVEGLCIKHPSLLFDTAIRADELIHLDLRDTNLKSEVLFAFINGKDNKERAVPMSKRTISLVEAYIAEYHSKRKDYDHPFVYTVIHGKTHRMSERNLERIVKKYADIVRKGFPSLPKSIFQYLRRRTRATGLYRDGVGIELIASTLGHASVQTTKTHYAYLSLEQKREALEKGQTGTLSSPDEKQEWPDDEDELAKLCGLR